MTHGRRIGRRRSRRRCWTCSSSSTRFSSPSPSSFASSAAQAPQVEDAVRRLVAAGLVHRHGEFLFPTRAAVYHEALFERRG